MENENCGVSLENGKGEQAARQARAGRVVGIGLLFNAVLAALKLTAGIFGHSSALLADGINSVSDVVYFSVVRIFVSLSGKPADREHPYGHYQYETIAALVVGAFVITTGIALFWDATNTLFDLLGGQSPGGTVRWFTLWTAGFTVIIKVGLAMHAFGVAKATKNMAVMALARDHRNDIFSSLGVAVGILASMMGLSWADPVAGALVALIVAKTGFDILREAADDLMDSVPGDELAQAITVALEGVEGILAVEDVHAHRFGPFLVANVTIGICGALSVSQGDAIATEAELVLSQRIEMLRKVYVHYHPVAPLPGSSGG